MDNQGTLTSFPALAEPSHAPNTVEMRARIVGKLTYQVGKSPV